MFKDHTSKITDKNIKSVMKQINLKKGYQPYFGTKQDTRSVITDIDHFPYTRFFRGVYHSSEPVVFEREAGWRPTRNSCYEQENCNYELPYPNHCFENACSTVFPCYTQYVKKNSTKLNSDCIMRYR